MGSFRNHLAKRIGDKRISPELQSGVAILWMPFETDAIDNGGVHSVGDGMTTLNRFPGVQLRRAEFRFLVRTPADARGIKNHLSAAELRRPRAFRIPLVSATLHAE